MKARYIILIIVVIVLIAAVGIFIYERAHVPFHSDENGTSVSIIGGDDSYIILDVRRSDEFADGHIPGAINVANESIGAESPAELADKNQLIYVYCRSGNRSKQAAEKLVALGYINIVEFGGIIDWTGEIVK